MAEEKEQSRGKSAVSSLGQQALEMGARRLVGQALSKAGAAIGSAFGPIGTAVGGAVGWLVSNKYVIGLIGGVAFFFLIFIPVIIFVILGLGGGSGMVSAEEEEVLSVTKTANPSQIKKNAPPTEVTYKITAENITANTTVKDVKVLDVFLGLDKSIGDLSPGDTHTETVKHTITDTSKDDIVTNIVTVTGTIPGAPPSADGLNYYILYGDTSIEPVNPEGIKAFANSRYPGNNIDVPCPGGVTCWDYVIAQSKAHKISPAFAITIWWEEGGFGGAGAKDEFGQTSACALHDFLSSFSCFLNFSGANPQIPANYFLGSPHPFDPSDPQGSFTEWVRYMCGTFTGPICLNNPDFISSLEDIYGGNDLAPGKIVYVSNGQNQGSGKTITVTATAMVIIGEPPQGPPTYAPLKGPVSSEGGYVFNPPTHEGLDIHTGNSDWSVYSPFAGEATVTTVADDGDCPVNCYGVYIDLRSGEWSVRMAHLERGAVNVKVGQVVNTNKVLGVMDDTGATSGTHVHYEIKKAEGLVDPAKHNALKGHP